MLHKIDFIRRSLGLLGGHSFIVFVKLSDTQYTARFLSDFAATSFLLGKGGVEHPTKFSKRWGLDGTSAFRGGYLRKGGDIFHGGEGGGGRGCNFHIKNKLKSEMFNDKKGL